MRSADFGGKFGMGADPVPGPGAGDGSDAFSRALTDKATKSLSEGGSGGCGGGMCNQSAAASKAAQAALGPPSQPIPPEQLAAICADMSPTGQANCQAAKQKNANIDAQNVQREAIIKQFVQSAIGGAVTDPAQLKLGDATIKLYKDLIAKYGDGVKYMTLQQVKDKYPDDAKAIVMSLSSQFPGLVGKDFDTVWNTIAPTFKDMRMMDLAAAIPNSSWTQTPAASGISPVVKAAGGGIAVLLLAGAAFVVLGRKKNVQA